MPLDYIQAETAIKDHFNQKWIDGLANGLPAYGIAAPVFLKRWSVTPYTPKLKWQNVELTEGVDNSEHWARFSSQNVLSRQATIAGGRTTNEGTRVTTKGIVIVQLFFSKSSYDDLKCKSLAFICQQALNVRNESGVWFRNSTILELAPEESFFRSNVTAEYEYDSITKGT